MKITSKCPRNSRAKKNQKYRKVEVKIIKLEDKNEKNINSCITENQENQKSKNSGTKQNEMQKIRSSKNYEICTSGKSRKSELQK